MKKLYLVGLGLSSEQDLSLRAIKTLEKCGSVFAEQYTNFIQEGSMDRLREIIKKDVMVLKREQVEGEEIILAAAKEGATALIVPGDPMTATTHSSLLESAQKLGIETEIIHSSSIFSAAPGACRLQIYKMAKTATITYWRENFEPDSFIDLIKENIDRGAHTLCLLDVDMQMGPMRVSKALQIIEAAQKKRGVQVIGKDTKMFALWHAGWPDQHIWAGRVSEFSEGMDREGPAVIIIPGKMHFNEEQFWSDTRS